MKVYVIYDGRYHADPDRSTILDTSSTLKGARRQAKDHGDAVIVEYDEVGDNWKNPRVIGPCTVTIARPAPADEETR